MKPANLPEEESTQSANEQPKRDPQTIIHRGIVTHYPNEEDRSPVAPPILPESQTDDQPDALPEPEDIMDLRDDFSYQADDIPQEEVTPESEPTVPMGYPSPSAPRSSERSVNPGMKLRSFEAAAKTAPPAKVPAKYRMRPNGETTRRAYWDVASGISLVFNVLLIGVLVIMGLQIKNLKATVDGLLGGVYGNLVEIDQATVAATIPVEAQIPVTFDLPIQQTTDVTLTDAVPVYGAYITLNDAAVPVNITLPAGTNLPIALDLSVPVQMTVPISLQLPANIPLNQTNLQAPLAGLQNTIRSLYCAFNRNAQYPDGVYICAEHDMPTIQLP